MAVIFLLKFNGFYDNTDIALKIMEVMGVKASVQMVMN